ncbi:MAG: DNA mismatch repair protein MutL, partial [Chloroflexota bacterium]|nr:DNA mismatch repair protein MutL [Chloroflexota bacterium]
ARVPPTMREARPAGRGARPGGGAGRRRPRDEPELADQPSAGRSAPERAQIAERATPLPRAALPSNGQPRYVAEVAEPSLSPAFAASPPQRVLPPLRMVGQLHRTFIIAEGPGGLVLIDQHGAHERVVYERLLAAAAGPWSGVSQPLLEPILLPLDAEESARWEAEAARLLELGFEADRFGPRTLRLRALPGSVTVDDAEALVRAVLADLSADLREPERFDRAAASAACHGSVRRGQVLDPAAMSSLLRDLEGCDQPHSCPHGRPTLVEISADDVLREFRRK